MIKWSLRLHPRHSLMYSCSKGGQHRLCISKILLNLKILCRIEFLKGIYLWRIRDHIRNPCNEWPTIHLKMFLIHPTLFIRWRHFIDIKMRLRRFRVLHKLWRGLEFLCFSVWFLYTPSFQNIRFFQLHPFISISLYLEYRRWPCRLPRQYDQKNRI